MEPECVTVIPHDGAILEMNAAGPACWKPKHLRRWAHGPALPFFADPDKEAFGGLIRRAWPVSRRLEFQAVGLRGGRLWLETHAIRFATRAGNVTVVLSVSRDVTARQVSQEKLTAPLSARGSPTCHNRVNDPAPPAFHQAEGGLEGR
jgi:hypothetical protein